MSDTAAPPADGVPADPHVSVAARTLHLLLVPTPGRLRNALMLVAGVLVVVTIWEVFRIPDAATACYVILFISRDERTTTIATAVGVAILGTVAVFVAVLVAVASLSEPALRIALMALITFGAMFMSRAARTGTPFFAVGFITVYSLTAADSVNLLGFQPATISNTTTTSLPTLLFLPPEEALLHSMLWLSLAVLVPGLIVVALNKAFGRDPAVLLRQGIAIRLAACAGFCEGRPGAGSRLATIARRGSPELLKLTGLAEKDHGARTEPAAVNAAEVRATTRVMLACLATGMLDDRVGTRGWMPAAARRCRALAEGRDAGTIEAGGTDVPGIDPLGREVHEALDAVAAYRLRRLDPPKQPPAPAPGFWTDDAFAAVNVQFALKVTLAVMTCYTLNNALDWNGIGTSVVTCFFVALGSLGESVHKMTLRLGGCLVGSALGIGSIILLMPAMTDLPDLLALMAVVVFVAAWVACGSERISYAGWQIGLAFFTVVLQGFGPVTDMEASKNRIVGILLGNVVSYLVMATIWPVRVDRLASGSLADTLDGLAGLLRRPARPETLREGVSVAVAKAQSLLDDAMFEGGDPGAVVAREEFARKLQALVIPVSMLAAADDRTHPDRTYPDLAAAFLDDLSGWLRRERPARIPPPSPPPCPAAPAGLEAAYALMARELAGLNAGRLR